jgi:hypothetical protein
MIWNRLRDFISGRVRRETLLSALIPLIFICYFGTITSVALVLPESYDWRSSVISNLLSARHNPQFHWVASLGLSLTGFLAIPFGGYIRDRLRPASSVGATIGMTAFITGFVNLILAATIVTRRSDPVIGKFGVHEILARTSALALGIGIVCFCWCVLRGFFAFRANRKLYTKGLVFIWSMLTFLPLLAALTCAFCTFLPSIGIPWLLPRYELLRRSPLWKLAFWEWIGSVAFFLFLVSAALLLPKQVREGESGRTGD